MAAVRSRGNLTTELAVVKIFRKEQITGWRRHKIIIGVRPDFVFMDKKVAVFVHGCFWHGCNRHGGMPKSNTKFWRKKIGDNKFRDLAVVEKLKQLKWVTIVIWEHEIYKKSKVITAKIRCVIR